MLGRSLVLEDPLEEEMAPYSPVLAWETPWTEEPGGLQSTGSQRVRHDRSDLAHTRTHVKNNLRKIQYLEKYPSL